VLLESVYICVCERERRKTRNNQDKFHAEPLIWQCVSCCLNVQVLLKLRRLCIQGWNTGLRFQWISRCLQMFRSVSRIL